MVQPKLILLNGFAGSGKSTIVKRYIHEHPLALIIEGDELIVNIGQWRKHEVQARELIFELTKSMARTYLASNHDVLLPYLVTDARHVETFEKIAQACDATFHEILLHNNRADAIARLLKRGTWGEADQDPLSDKDTPAIEDLMSKMESEREQRPNTQTIPIKQGDIDHTYQLFIDCLV